ncbi:MAG: hypothetical protein ABIO94_02880 [Opitutaceae bacterium]
MTPSRDALRAGSHWHVDCRLEGELPKDDAVSGRFLATIFFVSITSSLLLVSAWLGYQTLTLSRQVNEANKRIDASMPEVRIIQRLQKEYVTEASKIDQAYGVIRPAFVVSDFIGILSRTLPREINVDLLEWKDPEMIIMHGSLKESRQTNGRILDQYLSVLKSDPTIRAQFEVRQSAYVPEKGTFAFIFRPQPLPPL